MADYGIQYIKGDATRPISSMPCIIVHVCNDVGAWGAGFVLALSKRFGLYPKQEYLKMSKQLGTVGYVNVSNSNQTVYIANMIAQRGIRGSHSKINYTALHSCLNAVFAIAKHHGCTLHGPKFGCGLAGGDWTIISNMLSHLCQTYKLNIIIYE